MYYHNNYPRYASQSGYFPQQFNQSSYYHNGYYNQVNPYYYSVDFRQQTIQGQATWTDGGPVTQCGIPWSQNEFMTAAVGINTPYQCGQAIKVKYPATQRDLIVTVVDKVADYPQNRINLHRRAFEALGANTAEGVINIEITPSPELEEERWGRYLLEVTQAAYPAYRVTDYKFVEKTEVSPTKTREIYEFILQAAQETITVQGTVLYNPQTDRVISFDIKEL